MEILSERRFFLARFFVTVMVSATAVDAVVVVGFMPKVGRIGCPLYLFFILSCLSRTNIQTPSKFTFTFLLSIELLSSMTTLAWTELGCSPVQF